MEPFISSKNKLGSPALPFRKKNGLPGIFNNWYILFAVIGVIFGFLIAKQTVIGISIFVGLLGLLIALICISSVKAGLSIIITFSFFASYLVNLATFFLNVSIPVGVIFDLLVSLTFVGLLVNKDEFRQNFNRFSQSLLVGFIFFTLIFSAIQFFNPNSPSLNTNILAFRKFLGYVFIMFISYSFFNKYENVKYFLKFLFIISTISALYGIKQQWFGLFAYELQILMADPLGWGLIFVGGEIRKASTMADPAQFGIVMSVCAVFFLILSTHQDKFHNKVILGTGAIFMIMAMGYSGTRTAYAILVVAIAFYILLNINKKSTRIFAMIAIPVILFVLYAPIYGNKTIQRFRTTFVGGNDESYKVRILSRAFIQPYIRSHPIGGGLGTTGYEGARDHPGHYLAMFQPDSSYVRRGAETGWTGLAEICILYFIALYTGIKGFFRVKSENIKILAAGCISAIFAFYIAEFAQPALGQITDSVVYYPMLAIILRLRDLDRDTRSDKIES